MCSFLCVSLVIFARALVNRFSVLGACLMCVLLLTVSGHFYGSQINIVLNAYGVLNGRTYEGKNSTTFPQKIEKFIRRTGFLKCKVYW